MGDKAAKRLEKVQSLGVCLTDGIGISKKDQKFWDKWNHLLEVPVGKEGDSHTALTAKAWSPLTIRKVTKYGFPIYVGIITDDDLDGLDDTIHEVLRAHKKGLWKSDSLQDKRQLSGILHEAIVDRFEKTEGVAIVFMMDKAYIASLFGDFMNHAMCRSEFYSLLNMSVAI